ncbi:cell cycle control protein 50B [Callorhinchus milii]|uniref:Cell cycle control protein n=1 Tax=Callorhinchus milii TaxID=7868 RepID=V9KWN0_CALMI|nr:cell cycle control protein 50B [Callorhinchus milii]|eukprot:gi/632954464/ref/XP_007892977.1/ PREDICTED: cell cycle control protein 50A-like [Callorhinchus milii]
MSVSQVSTVDRVEASPKSNKPDNTAFTQQRLPAWQPILSAGYVLPLFIVFGLIFIGIGLGLHFTSNSIMEKQIDYTGDTSEHACYNCSMNANKNCKCTIRFTVTQMMKGPIFMYYGLSNFFQNNRKYVISRDDIQLFGDLDNFQNPSNYCFPFVRDSQKRPIVPCGAIANSLFNDSFTLYKVGNDNNRSQVVLKSKGISWWTDYNVKFKNPVTTNNNSVLQAAFDGTVKPLNWLRPAYELDTNPQNNGFQNEDFIVWMRIAALPTFRKLYRRIDEGLTVGKYDLEIAYNYPVLSFDGRKHITFSTISWMGGKNSFLGIAYLVCGSLCVVTGIVLLIVYIKYQKQHHGSAE